MPIIGAVTGGLDFSNYYTPLSAKIQSGLASSAPKSKVPYFVRVEISDRRFELPNHISGSVVPGHQRNE